MKKATLCVLLALIAYAIPVAAADTQQCTTIQSGLLTDTAGRPLSEGFDAWGYNYLAHQFNGFYDNYTRPDVLADSGDWLQMKWNDGWLSSQDCDGDGKLDRPANYVGSGAWLTNHMRGTYVSTSGKSCTWTYFVKIVAAPSDATLVDGMYYAADGEPIGNAIWGAFAITQERQSDPCGEAGGKFNTRMPHPGLGLFK